jgi:hypothetical protein
VVTRELRLRMAARAHAEDLAKAGAETPRHFESIASDPRLTRAERRQILQTLRDEMDATTPDGAASRDRIRRLLDERLTSAVDASASTEP